MGARATGGAREGLYCQYVHLGTRGSSHRIFLSVFGVLSGKGASSISEVSIPINVKFTMKILEIYYGGINESLPEEIFVVSENKHTTTETE